MKISENVVVTIIVLAVFGGIYYAKNSHNKVMDKVVRIDLEKDSVINILTRDNIEYKLKIVGKDSLLRLYYDKSHYLELLLNSKDKQITTVTKNSNTEILRYVKKLDSLTKYINSLERVQVPD